MTWMLIVNKYECLLSLELEPQTDAELNWYVFSSIDSEHARCFCHGDAAASSFPAGCLPVLVFVAKLEKLFVILSELSVQFDSQQAEGRSLVGCELRPNT